LGKILGGGFPIGCVGGREEVMHLADPRDWQAGLKNKSEMVWIGGGTFSANPMTMTAGVETLKILKGSKEIYEGIGRRGLEVRRGLREVFKDTGMKASAEGIHSCFEPKLTALDKRERVEWLIRLHNKGVFGHMPGGYVSAVHSDRDIARYLDATRETAREIKKRAG
jgi:glutamate-1-semialdehyde 2,1-aminomutase